MQRLRLLLLFAIGAWLLSACAATTVPGAAPGHAAQPHPAWAFEASDIPVDRAFRFGRLANGMRYVIRPNANPAGTVLVRFEFAVGSLDEGADERGYAHFTEHMAFNGSTHLAEGEMVRLMERHGLAFGSDNNASTAFRTTTYMLDLPRNDRALVDLSLMMMREIASELTFSPEAVGRARGVVLAELRERNTWALRNRIDKARFLHPAALHPRRFPIGDAEVLQAATAERLKAFWAREYLPEKATLIVIGDVDPATVEADIVARFASWRPAARAEPQPGAGPVDAADGGRTGIHLHQALSERITASHHGPWIRGPDTIAERKERLLRRIGYAIVNRRLTRIARQPDPPFRDAGFGTGEVFRAGRTTNLIVDTVDGAWRKGLIAAAGEYRRARAFGFSQAEVDEQVAAIRADVENAAASARTRSHAALLRTVFDLLRDDVVPSTPRSVLARFRAFAPRITAGRVFAAMQREAVPLDDPLLRFEGRKQPQGGEPAIREAWDEAMRLPVEPGAPATTPTFAYTSFGTPGTIVSDRREPALGIRELRFANGVMLNLKRTRIERGRVWVRVNLDGGGMLATRDNPLAVNMVRVLPVGGLGRHTRDELQSILAGHTINVGISSRPETFVSSARTTPRDLELQLQVYAAMITDPGYRREGEIQYRLNINHFFAQRNATPSSALANAIGGILSDDDPRFTLQPQQDYRDLTFEKLRRDLADRFAHGAIEIAIVGDVRESEAIAAVARTFGALPAREPAFGAYEAQRARPFTSDRSPRVLRHTGPADQALLRLTWPTRDDGDPVETLGLRLLQRVVLIKLTESLRGSLGKTYTPEAASSPSRFWRGFGTFGIAVAVDVREVRATRAAIAQALTQLREAPVSDDLFRRAREPLIESHTNALKTNLGWLGLVDRAQSEPDEIDRHRRAVSRLRALGPQDVEALARRYLDPATPVDVLVLPQGVEPPSEG
ncbi:MAG: insulinase family protein [Novosphingobium sp.]